MRQIEFAVAMKTFATLVPKFAPDFSKPEFINSWFGFFQHIDSDRFRDTILNAARTCEQFPSIAEMLVLLGEGEQPDDDKAREVAELIYSTLCSRGSMLRNKKELLKVLGRIGVEVVERQGGWMTICEQTTHANTAIFKAQWRELAAALIRKAKTGDLAAIPDFSRSEGSQNVKSKIEELANKFSLEPANKGKPRTDQAENYQNLQIDKR